MKKTIDIVTLGEFLIDMFPAELGRSLAQVTAFNPKPGGAPANVAVAASRLGARSGFIGKVGDDAFGHHLAEVLKEQNVETRGMRFDQKARTGLAFIAKPDENTAEYLFYRNPGADMLLEVKELDHSLLEQTRAFHFGSISLIHEPCRSATVEAIRIARQAGALISFDVNYRASLWDNPQQAIEQINPIIPQVDLLKVNEDEMQLLAGTEYPDTAGQILLDRGPRLIVATLGPDGSYFRLPQGGQAVPGFTVQTVDAVGCGDAFIAGILSQLVGSGDWHAQLSVANMQKILRYGNAVGALTARKQGVIPALPTAAQVESFLNERQ